MLQVSYLVLILLNVQLCLLVFSPEVPDRILGASQLFVSAGLSRENRGGMGLASRAAIPLQRLDMGLQALHSELLPLEVRRQLLILPL